MQRREAVWRFLLKQNYFFPTPWWRTWDAFPDSKWKVEDYKSFLVSVISYKPPPPQIWTQEGFTSNKQKSLENKEGKYLKQSFKVARAEAINKSQDLCSFSSQAAKLLPSPGWPITK